MTLRALALVSVLAVAPAARAGTIELVPSCVVVDSSHDSLGSLERTQAATMLRHVLEEQDLLVVDSGCVDTYTVFHIQDGAEWIVHVRGPHGGRKLHVAGMADFPAAYEKMVRSLLEPAPAPPPAEPPVAAPAPIAPPETVEAEPPPPPTSTTKRLLYAQVGIGGMGGASGPGSFSGGYRFERAGTAFDGSITTFSSSGDQAVSGTRATGKILSVLAPDQSTSAYMGGGLGISGSTIQLTNSAYSGKGLEGSATVGIDFRRDTGLRMFVQVDAILPFYMMSSNLTDETEYAGSVMVSFGIGPAGR